MSTALVLAKILGILRQNSNVKDHMVSCEGATKRKSKRISIFFRQKKMIKLEILY